MNKNYLTLTIKTMDKSAAKLNSFFILIAFFFGINLSLAQSPATYTTSGTFTVPLGVTSITIDCIGAGGSGGTGRGNNNQGAGGGAGGQYARSTIAVSAGQVYTVTVAGITIAPSGTNYQNGNTGSFSEVTRLAVTHARANGGNGGIAANASRAGGIGNTTGAVGNVVVRRGGNGGNGTASASGAGGGGAGTTANGGDATGTTAGTGATLLGGNGAPGYAANNPGTSGFDYGGGGSGGRRDNTGGNGAQGFVQITYTCPALVSNAGPNQTLAACATTATLAANTPVNSTGLWTVVSGSGAVTTPTSPTSGVTGIVPGTPLVLRWTVSNGSCGSTNTTVTITSPIGAGCLAYCTPSFTSGVEPISNVTFNTINNSSANVCGAGSQYENFSATSTTVIKSSIYNLSVTGNTCGNFTNYIRAYVDWNIDGDFLDAGESFDLGTIVNTTTGLVTLPITIPAGATTGAARMRIMKRFNAYSANACETGAGFGQAEDYTLNIIDPAPCVTPTTQPTALVLTPASSTINGTFTAAIPAPNSYLVVMNTTGVTPTPTNGTTYTIGSTVLGGTNVIIDTDSNTSFSATLLAPNTTYYFFIYSFNNFCTGGPLYRTVTPLTGNATTPLTYCTVAAQNVGFNDGITRVQFNTINNITSANAGNEYNDYTAISTTVTQGQFHNLSVYVNTDGAFTQYQRAWFDWNRDGDFDDAGEAYNLGSATNVANGISSLCPLSVLIPVTSVTGAIRMRVSSRYNTYANPCDTGYDGEIEDYTIIINAAPPCVAPTAQPTALILTAGTPSGTAINGNFVAAIPAAQSYLVVMNTTNIAPTSLITNGSTYTIGGSIGVGNTVVDTDTNTTFTATGLNNSTTYYFFIYSMNNLCSGGPLYRLVSPLTGNATTTATNPTYCTPVTVNPNNTNRYISRVAFIGTLNDTDNISTFSAATPGYQDFTGLAAKSIQAQGEGVNLIVEGIGGRAKLIAWIDWNKNGLFEDSEIVYNPGAAGISATFGFVIPSGTVPGNYRIRVRTFNSFYNDGNPMNGNPDEYFGYNFNSCETFNTGTIGGFPTTQYGEAEDYLFTVIQRCDANILSVTDGQVCNSGTVTLSATGTAGTTQYRWYANATGGAQLAGSPTVGSWTTPSISTTTTYYVTAFNGSCESLVRTPVVANVNSVPTLTFTPSSPETCGENNIISLTASGDKQLSNLLFENFESGLGSFTNVNSDPSAANIKNDTRWTQRSSTHIPAAGISWKPAISSGLAPNSFALANADPGTAPTTLIENSLVSGVLNSTGYLNLTMTMKFYYSRYYPDNTNNADEFVRIQISQNGGTTWTTLGTDIVADTGIGTRFANLSFNLNAYINQTNLRVRILHHSLGSVTGWLPDGVAVDDIKIFGEVPLGTSFNWVSVLPVDAYQDAACTIPYVSGTPAIIVYIKPTLAQLEQTTYSFTASALLSNGCSASSLVSINNKSKVWKGSTNGDWNNANNWSPVGVPDATTCVIIPPAPNNSLVGGTSFNGFGKTLQVINGGNLRIDPTNTLTITDLVEVRGGTSIFDIENSASLIQINNVANIGNITMRRTATAGALDYVYWSTPVAGFSINNVLPTAGINRYLWNPTVNNGGTYAGNFGNWSVAAGAMTTGRGYIKLNSGGTTNFVGVPNNGNISIPITRGTYNLPGTYVGPTATPVTRDDDNWNLLGNPYPSAINAVDFLAANTGISGFVKVWSHGTLPVSAVDPFYQDFVLNYTTSDYITTNGVGSTPPGYDGRIGAGQGFFVLMNHATATPGTVVFNNTMRSNAYRNDQFYRSDDEKNRIWLSIISPSNTSITTLVGYVTDATNNLDNMYDAIAQGVKTNFELYSIAESQELIIQGRSLPFNQNDEVPLGVSIPQNGIYTIAISNVDGLFTDLSQGIYIEDKQLGIIHDLRTAPYTFTGTVGRDENRFTLLYNSSRLSQDDINFVNNVLVATNENVTVYSSTESIDSIEVYDLLGKLVKSYSNINSSEFILNNLNKNDTTLLLKIKLNNGSIVNKKIIF
ncbi:GEVED domain-containing protein [Flavobacterium sp.]|uniref:GEVED domain-containing protein n=1 Tax=Flavobacterium sp. TaxID=239 RepID=UPI003D2C833F